MCLILLAWRCNARLPLVVAANRDEFHARPAAPAWFWPDAPQVMAGRDIEAGGTWLGITRSGRFAALTNFRDPQSQLPGMRSRGELVADFLRGKESPADYAKGVVARAHEYNGFNLLFGDQSEMRYASNAGGGAHVLAPGIYGLSNHLLDTPWPKVARARSRLDAALAALPGAEPLFALLHDQSIAPDDALPRTGVSLEWERLLSAAFVQSSDYGTRNSTVLMVDARGEVEFEERSFGPDTRPTGSIRSRFRLSDRASNAS